MENIVGDNEEEKSVIQRKRIESRRGQRKWKGSHGSTEKWYIEIKGRIKGKERKNLKEKGKGGVIGGGID